MRWRFWRFHQSLGFALHAAGLDQQAESVFRDGWLRAQEYAEGIGDAELESDFLTQVRALLSPSGVEETTLGDGPRTIARAQL